MSEGYDTVDVSLLILWTIYMLSDCVIIWILVLCGVCGVLILWTDHYCSETPTVYVPTINNIMGTMTQTRIIWLYRCMQRVSHAHVLLSTENVTFDMCTNIISSKMWTVSCNSHSIHDFILNRNTLKAIIYFFSTLPLQSLFDDKSQNRIPSAPFAAT